MKKIIFTFTSLALSLVIVSSCSQTQYAAHVAKQVVLPQDAPSKSKGYFKVGSSYKIKGRRYYPAETYNLTEKGTASWYGPGFHGKQTANGEIFDQNEMTAAHRTLQLPSIIKVTNLDNGRSAILRVNDRGPFAHNRILDVSERGASVLGFKSRGVAKIRLEVIADASKEVAALARDRKSTRGYEVAYANGERGIYTDQVTPPAPTYKPEPVTQIVFEEQGAGNEQPVLTASIPAVQSQPLDDVVQQAAGFDHGVNSVRNNDYAQSSGRLFVQAASFSQETNALKYSDRLSAQYSNSRVYRTQFGDQPYFRVRLGPFNNPSQAQQVVTALHQGGNQNAIIVTD